MKLFILLAITLNLNVCNNKSVVNKNEIADNNTIVGIVATKEKPSINSTTTKIDSVQTMKKNYLDSYYEDSIEIAISKMFKNKNADAVDSKLKDVQNDSEISKSYQTYWTTYLNYYKAIFYKGTLKDDSKASKFIDKAIESIEDNLSTTEDYALYATCLSYSIQFANITQLASISSSVNNNAEKALSLNNKNLRAYYVLASHNFYTPRMFGGMSKVEQYAYKGLKCPNSLENGNYYAPYWGKPRIYSILIDYYKAENNLEKLEETKVLAKNEFPNMF